MTLGNNSNKETFNQTRENLKMSLMGNFVPHAALYPMTAAAAVGFGFLGTTSTAEAGIIFGSGPVSITNGSSAAWDIDGDSFADMTLFDSTSDTRTFCAFSSGAGAGFAELSSGSDELDSILAGDTVGAGNTYKHLNCADLSDATCVHEHWDGFTEFNGGVGSDAHVDADGVIGFMFDNAGTTNYGLARFEIRGFTAAAGDFGTFSITEWAYEDSGSSISGGALGAVPEPTSLAIFALGGLTLGATSLRRRRKQAA